MAAPSTRHFLPLLPAGATEHFGATSSTWTFSKAVAGYATKTGATSSTWTFTKAVAGHKTTTGATTSTWTLTATTAGTKTTAGTTYSLWTFQATTAGAVEGQTETPPTVVGAGRPRRRPIVQAIPEGKPLHLEPQTARVLIRAIAPRLTIGLVIASPTLRARAHAAAPSISYLPAAAKVVTFHRAERDPSSLDLDRELAVLLEA